jgi:diguanylate cyclase
MPVTGNTSVFLLGLAAGAALLVMGLVLGYWFGRKTGEANLPIQGQQFLAFLRTMSQWTSEFSGDVIKYQNQLSSINQRVQQGSAPREELVSMVSEMMETNRKLQLRLDQTEQKLESQTGQLASYLKEARTDGLTGLMNRRAFDKSMDDLFTQWQKQNRTFCVGLIDIDHFKHINDTYGHPAGDAVLKQVAQTLQSELKDGVCVARFGGEEFSFLTLSPLDQAAKQLDDLRGLISKIQVEHEGKCIDLTLSAGVSQVTRGERIGPLVRRADEALYASKMAGRNRVHLHDGSNCQLVTKVAATPSRSSSTRPEEAASVQQREQIESSISIIQERLQRIVQEESQRLAGRSAPRNCRGWLRDPI